MAIKEVGRCFFLVLLLFLLARAPLLPCASHLPFLPPSISLSSGCCVVGRGVRSRSPCAQCVWGWVGREEPLIRSHWTDSTPRSCANRSTVWRTASFLPPFAQNRSRGRQWLAAPLATAVSSLPQRPLGRVQFFIRFISPLQLSSATVGCWISSRLVIHTALLIVGSPHGAHWAVSSFSWVSVARRLPPGISISL